MKRILVLVVFCFVVFAFGTCCADDVEIDILRCLENGMGPDDEGYQRMLERCETINGCLYDTTTKTLVQIPDDADCGDVLMVEPGTKYICAGALEYNGVSEIYLPDGLRVIGNCALNGKYNCAEEAPIQIVHVPASVRLIRNPAGYHYIGDGNGKPYFQVDENNPWYCSTSDGLLIDKENQTVLSCASFQDPRVVTVPEDILEIAPYAFAGCYEIISIQLPDSLSEIGDYAISMMHGLVEITIPENVRRIGSGNFNGLGGINWKLEDEKITSYGETQLTDEELLQI